MRSRARAEGARGGRDARALGGGAAEAPPALRRPAPARRNGKGARARAGGVPDGRAALEPRREPARPDARRGRAVQRRLGVATLYVTHDQTEAMTMGDRVAVLRGGTLQQIAAPQELYERPANLFVASFIGSPAMNSTKRRSRARGSARPPLGSQRLDRFPRSRATSPGTRRRRGAQDRGRNPARVPDHGFSGGRRRGHERTLSVRAELVESLGNESLVHFSTDARKVRNHRGVFTAEPDSCFRRHRRRVGNRRRRTRRSARQDRRRRPAHPCRRRRPPPLLRRRDREHDRRSRAADDQDFAGAGAARRPVIRRSVSKSPRRHARR